MFSGEFKHSLDTKNRLFIPAKHREELGESFMVAKSIRENCLKVYSMAEWEEYISQITAWEIDTYLYRIQYFTEEKLENTCCEEV